jgi:hypothetical protein
MSSALKFVTRLRFLGSFRPAPWQYAFANAEPSEAHSKESNKSLSGHEVVANESLKLETVSFV